MHVLTDAQIPPSSSPPTPQNVTTQLLTIPTLEAVAAKVTGRAKFLQHYVFTDVVGDTAVLEMSSLGQATL